MDYGNLLNRTWSIIWEHKFLILLGVLVTLSSGFGSSSSNGVQYSFADSQNRGFRMPEPGEMPNFERMIGPAISTWLAILLIGFGLLIAVVLWVVSTIARGGLIEGAAAADNGQSMGFSQAWSAGWRRGWTLLGIGLIPAIPGLLILLVAGGGLFYYLTNTATSVQMPFRYSTALIGIIIACLVVPFALLLELLRALANRACMLEKLNVINSYVRGIKVLLANLGSALVLFLIQIVLSIAMIILLLVPSALLALCCFFLPVLLLVQGAITAFYSTMWTLAWRRWSDTIAVPVEPAAALGNR